MISVFKTEISTPNQKNILNFGRIPHKIFCRTEMSFLEIFKIWNFLHTIISSFLSLFYNDSFYSDTKKYKQKILSGYEIIQNKHMENESETKLDETSFLY